MHHLTYSYTAKQVVVTCSCGKFIGKFTGKDHELRGNEAGEAHKQEDRA